MGYIVLVIFIAVITAFLFKTARSRKLPSKSTYTPYDDIMAGRKPSDYVETKDDNQLSK